MLPKAEIYLIGSVVREEAIGSSDVDMVVILPRRLSPREEAELKALIERGRLTSIPSTRDTLYHS